MINPIYGRFKIVQTMNPKGGENMVGGSKFLKDRNYCGASLCMDVLIWLSFL